MPAPKDYIKIPYPRSCEKCNHVSNNPQTYHYHIRTHEPIPSGTLCWQGCGLPAQYRGTGGKYTCQKVTQHCPAYIKSHSNRITEYWQRPNSRSKIEKQIQTKRKKFNTLTPEDSVKYRHYSSRVRKRAQQWAKEQGYELGVTTYHVDHKLSILDAWKANLPAEIVNHPANLQILEAKQNSSKGSKSSITIDELLKLISRPCGPG